VVVAASAFLCPEAGAQSTTSSGFVNTSWGYYTWQVDRGSVTTTLTSETGFNASPGAFQTPVTIPAGTTIHEVHGTVMFTVWSPSSCPASIIAQVRDQSGNAIVSVFLTDFAPATDNIGLSATFPNGLPITSLQLAFVTTQCGAVTHSWSLVMN
jgi:hypothetical protein